MVYILQINKTNENDDDLKKNDRSCLWTTNQTKALISAWGDAEIQQEMQNSRRNIRCFMKISEMLRKCGVYRTAKQCQRKIKVLKQEYRKVINHNKTNSDDVKTCQFFSELDNILSSKDSVLEKNILTKLGNTSSIKDSDSLPLQASTSTEISAIEETAPASIEPSNIWMLQGIEDSQAASQILLVRNAGVKGTTFRTLGMGHTSNSTPGPKTRNLLTRNAPKAKIISKREASTQTLDQFQAKRKIISDHYELLSAQKTEEHELTMKQKEEEHSLKLEILNEKLKLFKSINKKIENGGQIHLCINQFD